MSAKTLTLAAPLAFALALASTTSADAQRRGGGDGGGVRVGTLVCDVAGGIGLIVTSQRRMACRFDRAGGPDEAYAGVIRRFGLDIGATGRAGMVWAVFAPSRDRVRPGALAGTYAGVSGEATLGAGLGANVLVGGGRRSFTLQPLSIQGQTGLNLAAGVASLELVGVARRRR